MSITLNTDPITHSIQLALAPAFLLTAIASMIATISTRLGRVVDRFRQLHELIKHTSEPAIVARAQSELKQLRLRGRMINLSIGLLTLSAFLIGTTIIALFLSKAALLDDSHSSQVALFTFISSVFFFLLALLCFLWETLISTRILSAE
jgi:uncharacterized membrane protein